MEKIALVLNVVYILVDIALIAVIIRGWKK